MKPTSRLRSFLILASSAFIAISSQAHAANIWDGGGVDGNWTTVANWDNNAVPGTGALTFTGILQTSTNNDRAAGFSYGGINFTNDGSVGKTNAFTLGGSSSINLTGNITTTANTTGSTITDLISLPMVLSGGGRTITTNQLSSTVQHNLTISGVISQDASNRSLTKAGAGTLTLNGSATNTFAGGLIINGGLLVLDYANIAASTSLVANTNTLTLKGGDLTLKGLTGLGNTTTQGLGNVTISSGGGTLLIDPNGGDSTTLTLGTLTATTQGSSFTLGKALGVGSGTVTITTASNKNAQDIYGGRIAFADGTANTGYDWATTASVGSPYTLSAYSGYSAMATSGTDTANSRITASSALVGTLTTNSLKIENPAASQSLDLDVNTLTLTSGGLLVTGTNAVEIKGTAGNKLTAGNGSGSYDLIVHQFNSGGLNIGAVIGNNGANATALTKSGTGSLTLSGSNTFTGGLFINSGAVTLNNAGALNNSTPGTSENAVTMSNSTTLSLNGQSYTLRSLNSTNTTDLGGGAIVQNAHANAVTLTVGNSGNAASTFAGVIQDGSGGGALSLVKAGTNTLILSGVNTFTGDTSLNAGKLTITSLENLGGGASTGDIIFNGTAELNMNTATPLTFGSGRTVTINGAAATMTSGNGGKTFQGVLEGTGSLSVTSTTSFSFTNAANTFSGTLNSSTGGATSYGLELASIGDGVGAGLINLGSGGTAGTLRWLGASGSTTTLANRQFALSGTTGGGTISALGTTSADNLVISKNLLVSGTGNKKLTLAGTNAGANTFAGDITDGTGSVITLEKTEGGIWALGGTNTYSGVTNLAASGTTGVLIFQGNQSLSPNTKLVFAQNSSNRQSVRFLDDGASPGVISFNRPIEYGGSNTVQSLNILVGNNNSANGGSSSGTTTGRTIQVGDITHTSTAADTSSWTINATSPDGYRLQTGTITLNNLVTRTANNTTTTILNPTTANLTVPAITMADGNTGTANDGVPVLRFDGTSSDNRVTGTISNASDYLTGQALSLQKQNTSTWILEGSNTYSGTTAITGGTLASTNAVQGFGTNLNGISIGGSGTLSLLNNNSVSFTNGTSAYNIANSAGGATINVDRASGTGSNTITVGNLTTTSTAATWGLNFTGANGVSLNAGALNTPASTATNPVHTITNNIAGGGSLTLASVFNQVTTPASPNLVFAGTGSTIVTGAITQTQADMDLLKNDAGTLTLNSSNTYTGATNINGGTLIITGSNQSTSAITFSGGGVLGLTTATTVNAASATVNFTGQQVLVTGTTGAPSYALLNASSITGTPTLAAGSVSGYTLQVVGNQLQLVQTGAPVGYAAWQAANGTAGDRSADHDNDGVDNGTEHFLGGTANTTGFTALPTVVNNAGILSVTWPKAGTYTGAYTTDYVVETSATLTGPWTTETLGGGNITDSPASVKYTFPGGPAYTGKLFARLKVTGP